jgi:hypothetical protein
MPAKGEQTVYNLHLPAWVSMTGRGPDEKWPQTERAFMHSIFYIIGVVVVVVIVLKLLGLW